MGEQTATAINATHVGSRFSAFLSYCHTDAVLTRKLHAQIEAYRLPIGMGSIGTLSGRGGRLGRVFRDREDFSAAHDLSAAVKDALDHSQVLVVACSPDAKSSRWVNQEITYFRSQHPGRSILAAILRGEPQEAFPTALLEGGLEPLAADLRKEKDGWHLGFLKIVAGIAGIPLDALIQRDSQRKMRRVMAVTGMVALIAIAMGVMTMIALQARSEAEFQRNQANGFVTALLERLQPTLRGQSNTQARSELYGLAANYYRDSGLDGFTDDQLEARAQLLHAWGAEDQRQGDQVAALAKYVEAHRATEALLMREPENPDRTFAHAQSHYWIGDVAYRQGKWSEAEQSWLSYRDLALDLYRSDPGDPAWISEAGYGEGNICTLELQREDRATPDFARARTACAASMRFFREAAEIDPEDAVYKVNIANRHAWLADIHRGLDDQDAALAERYAGEAIIDGLLETDPDNLDWSDLWIASQIAIANAEQVVGKMEEAKSRRRYANTVLATMIRRDPNNAIWNSYSSMLEENR